MIRRVRPRARTPLFNRIPAAFPLLLLAVVAPPLILLPSRTPQASPPPHPKPAPRPQIERRIQAEGVDRHQHSAKFTIYVLSADLSWKLESVTDLEGNRPLLNPELHQAINRAQEVFCVGTASFEGATDSEERRAVRRAQTLAEWAGSAIEDRRKTHLYPVSAGQYRGPDSLTSSLQRKASSSSLRLLTKRASTWPKRSNPGCGAKRRKTLLSTTCSTTTRARGNGGSSGSPPRASHQALASPTGHRQYTRFSNSSASMGLVM